MTSKNNDKFSYYDALNLTPKSKIKRKRNEKFSKWDQEFIQAAKETEARDQSIENLFRSLAGRRMLDLSSVIRDQNWRIALAQATRNHMLRISKQMTYGEVKRNLNDLRLVEELVKIFRDVLYSEQEIRKFTVKE